jgi:hypothetical protein
MSIQPIEIRQDEEYVRAVYTDQYALMNAVAVCIRAGLSFSLSARSTPELNEWLLTAKDERLLTAIHSTKEA